MIFWSYRVGIDPRFNQFLTVVSPSPMARASCADDPQIAMNVFLSMIDLIHFVSHHVNTFCVVLFDNNYS